MKHIDIKVTVWNRMVLQDNANIEQIITDLKANGIEHVIDGIEEWDEVLTLWETEELLSPDDNDQCSTIEVWDNNDLIWANEININNIDND